MYPMPPANPRSPHARSTARQHLGNSSPGYFSCKRSALQHQQEKTTGSPTGIFRRKWRFLLPVVRNPNAAATSESQQCLVGPGPRMRPVLDRRFSAGRPNASHPIGCSPTHHRLNPRMLHRATNHKSCSCACAPVHRHEGTQHSST